ncbi:AAA family ATPase [Undibacterium sp. TS12]|uniref:AAA family ATPase n=1 Tax=Undibacterium sp. TS12 TaxID=2908202 RepID=UPI001F4C8037|nr:AAA family ATPase [Undibacterium sp. TS12]MCH8621377.1 AAA family ATPase [Undibacterium sp. TS12]
MPASRLEIRLLGIFELRQDGQDFTSKIKYRKAVYLLAYLIVANGRWISREHLAGLLWPDLHNAAGLTNLRQVLNNLGKVINTAANASIIQSRRDSIAYTPNERVSVDISLLLNDRHVDDASEEFHGWLANSFEAHLYQLYHDFLETMEHHSGTELQAWILSVRKQARERWRELALRLCINKEVAGRVASATAIATQLWEQDPLNEHIAAKLISLLLACGDFKRANFVLNALDQGLLSAFGTRASAATRKLLEQKDLTVIVNQPQEHVQPVATPKAMEMRYISLMYVEFDLTSENRGQGMDCLSLLDELLTGAKKKIELWAGNCNEIFGQGFHASFGLYDEPEQAALRSIYAAQEVLLSEQSRRYLRIGVCAGHVQRSIEELRFLGALPRLAQEICWSADVGQLVFDQMVAEQIREKIAIEKLPLQQNERYAKGLSRFIVSNQVVGTSGVQVLPLIGRSEEMQVLMQHWHLADHGQAQWLVLRGNAGMGKTRLATELASQLQTMAKRVISVHCSLEYQHQSMAPIRYALSDLFGLATPDDSEKIREKIVVYLRDNLSDSMLEEAHLHALVVLFEQKNMSEVDHKNQLFAAVAALFDLLCHTQSCLILIDDMHWSDFATREFVARYAGSLERQRLLLLVTTRPDAPLEYAGASPLIAELSALPLVTAEQMVAACDSRHLLSREEHLRIARDCGGIPLFLERLTRSLAEDGRHHLVPVKELLQSELDKLGPYKYVLQFASALGYSFDARLLTILLPDADIDGTLQLAITYRLVKAAKKPGYYSFLHALIADTAYQSFPEAQRRQAHQQIAQVLLLEPVVSSSDIARHFDVAQCWAEALDWWTLSGQQAMAGEFAMDALQHFKNALAIAEHPQHGLVDKVISLRLSVGSAALLCQGYGSELGFKQFRAVFDSLDMLPSPDPEQKEALFRALSGMYMGGSSQGRSDGLGFARRLEELADTPAKRLMACFALGNSLFWRGLFTEALQYQQEGVAISRELSLEQRQRYWGEDLEILIRAFLSWNLWFLAHEEAMVIADESLALARERKKSHALCFMLTFNAALHWTKGQVDQVMVCSGEGVALGTQFGFPLWQSMNSLFYLSAQASRNDLQDAAPALQAADALHGAYRAGTTTASWVLASTLVSLNRWSEAKSLLLQTLADIDRYEDYYCHSDLLRLQGLCQIHEGELELARQTLQHALQMAETQGALGLIPRIRQSLNELKTDASVQIACSIPQ